MGGYQAKVKCINKSSQRLGIAHYASSREAEHNISHYCEIGETIYVDTERYFIICPGITINPAGTRPYQRYNPSEGLSVICCKNGCCITIADDTRSCCHIINKSDDCVVLKCQGIYQDA